MIKTFLISIIFPILLFSSQQILLVVADDFNTSTASLELFEEGSILFSTKVNIGKNGLGWGLGEIALEQNIQEPLKKEGDKKAPAGVFKLFSSFGYKYSPNSSLPYLYADKQLICVDDSHSPFYNQIIMQIGDEQSFEYMRRDDHQYKYGITVGHNLQQIKGRGSCIFLHIQKAQGIGTAGCTSMKEEDLKKILKILDKNKNPIFIQIPKSSSKEIKKLYPKLKNSKLL